MTLRDMNLKVSYDSTEDNILEDFYIPALTNSISYSRIAGFFSSTALAVAARGISYLIRSGGNMKIIAAARLSKEDITEIVSGEELNNTVSKSIIREIDSLEDHLVKDHVKALGWMVRNDKLQIRVAIPTNSDGIALDQNTVLERGIFHQKLGILEDTEGNVISFSGSVNETATAWLYNIEEFKIFRNWVEGETYHLRADLEKFERFWNGLAKNTIVMDVPTAVKDKLISISPNNLDELDLHLEKSNKLPELREYQYRAVDEWVKIGRGLIEMATGTGKTYVAIACLERLLKKEKKLAVIISCPFIHLIDQWQKNLSRWSHNGNVAFGSYQNWVNDLSNKIYDLNNGYRTSLIVVTTHSTFASTNFTNLVNLIKCPIFLIADEVHALGSSERRTGLLEKYAYRLGLSATPKRWFDDEGTQFLLNFFGDTVFELGIKEAIPEYLTPYEYVLNIVELTPDELHEYMIFSRKIAKQYFINKNDPNKKEGLKLLAIRRHKIITNARNKMEKFVEILKSIKKIRNCLVYCSPEQIDNVQEILNDIGIIQHKFTAKESFNERREILSSFEDGTYQTLVAMKCLDEGVDVPGTQMAIILASSTNPREFIQRRGRILRKHPSKDKSIIHDILVIPAAKPDFQDDFLFEIERRAIAKELKRIVEFASNSLNYVESLNKIYPVIEAYKIKLEELSGE
jgi:superfamily II DNA or RNA helicase